jgi:hypothetical protein
VRGPLAEMNAVVAPDTRDEAGFVQGPQDRRGAVGTAVAPPVIRFLRPMPSRHSARTFLNTCCLDGIIRSSSTADGRN